MAGAGHGTKSGRIPAIKGSRIGEPRPTASALARMQAEHRQRAGVAMRRLLISGADVMTGLGDLAGRFSAGSPDEGRGVTITFRGQNRIGNDIGMAAGRLRAAGFDAFQTNAMQLHVVRPTARAVAAAARGASI